MIIACISAYREGRLLEGARASAAAGCDRVIVCDGPVERWGGDAGKRTHMLELARSEGARVRAQKKGRKDEPLWVLWLDADELLLWGEYLRDWIGRVEEETGAGGFPLRIVELDGSVALAYGKVIRADYVRRYLHSSYQVELTNGVVVALPNVKICGAGGVPYGPFPHRPDPSGVLVPAPPGSPEVEEYLGRHRPPLAGEPHLLHRSLLRSPERSVRRLSEVEAEWFEERIR
jgi:hypothetical protein